VKALVYHGAGKKSLDERPMPQLASPTDAIVKVTRTTICGTDLHILKGAFSAMKELESSIRLALPSAR